MNITQIAFKYNRVTIVLLIVIVFLGFSSYNQLPRDSMPPYTIRVATVVTYFPGASPERIELLITDKIEKVAQEIPEVDYIASESRTGLSVVSVALHDYVSKEQLLPIWDRLRRKIELISSDLPSGIYGPEVRDEDIGVVYGISLGLINDGFEYHELEDYAEDIRDRIIKMEDAAKVELGGVIDQRIYIDFDNAKLAEFGISSNQLRNIISSTNIIIPAGEINLGDERIILEPSGSFQSIEEIRQILIPTGQNQHAVPLGDITVVYSHYISPQTSMIKINGLPAIALYISLREKANIIELGKQVDQFVADQNKLLPEGISLMRIASQDYEVQKSISNFVGNLVQSVVIVMLIMFLFLGFRTGVVVASLIPAAFIFSMFLMDVFNVGLNQVTLAALIMALGLLVDNAIVMSESMLVKMKKGLSTMDAAIESSRDLIIPLLTSSLTTSAAFLSFYLAESIMSEMMGPLFQVITITLLSSWIMSMTLVPLMALSLLKLKKATPNKVSIFDKLIVHYKRMLEWSLKKPMALVGLIVLALFLSLFGFTKIPVIFQPDSDRNLITVDMNLPMGTHIETTEKNAALIEQFIADSLLVNETRKRGVQSWAVFIGEGPNSYDLGYFPGEANSGYAHLLVNTSAGKDNLYVISKLDNFCFNNLPDAEMSIKALGAGGGAAIPIEVRISGPDVDELYRISSQIKEMLTMIPGTKNVSDDWGPKIKKFFVDIDPARLALSGLTNQDIAVSANTTLSGFNVGEYRLNDKNIPIIMRTEGSEEISFTELEGLNIFNQSNGTNIPLAQVATITTEWQYSKRLRRDLIPNITVQSQVLGGYTANEIVLELNNWLENESKNWGYGYEYDFGGDAEGRQKAMSAIGEKLPVSLFIIALLLVLQFNSIRKSTIILSTIPLGIIGIVAGLLITNSFFSFTAFLGIISLAGVIINNAIVLIERIQYEKDRGLSDYQSVVSATQVRFRPILLTTFTTSFGLIPLWIGGGAMWRPMAIAIIFGLLFATVITLLFVPIIYSLLYKVRSEQPKDS